MPSRRCFPLPLACSIAAIAALSAGCGRPRPLEAWFVDSLVKVFPDHPPGRNRLAPAAFPAARGSHLSIQIALRSDVGIGDIHVEALPLAGPGMPIDRMQARKVEYVVVTTNTANTPPEELERKAPALFPDALLPGFPMTIERDKTRSVWITVPVPEDQAPGDYRGDILIRQGAAPLMRLPYTVTVKPARVPRRIPLAVSNHFTFADARMQQFYGAARYSDAWWSVVENTARFLGQYRQTSIPADPVSLATAEVRGGRLVYDFRNFERFVGAFEAAGVRGDIEGGNLLLRERRRNAPVKVRAWIADGARAVLSEVPVSDRHAGEFLGSFLPALKASLEKNGWMARYLQGVLDEPNEWEREDFVQTALLVRKQLPVVRIMEPVGARQDLSFMEKTTDIWVPCLGSFDDKLDVLERHAQSGGTLWYYTCLAPRGRYPNRFIDYSLTKVRVLHWINFRWGFRGFLHWGGNYWGPEPMKDTQPVINEGRTYLPPGDAYITYPNRAGRSLYSSIRLEQMREGIEDYGLLAELSRLDPEKAKAIAGKMVRSFVDYVRAPAEFRAIHQELLNAFPNEPGGSPGPGR